MRVFSPYSDTIDTTTGTGCEPAAGLPDSVVCFTPETPCSVTARLISPSRHADGAQRHERMQHGARLLHRRPGRRHRRDRRDHRADRDPDLLCRQRRRRAVGGQIRVRRPRGLRHPRRRRRRWGRRRRRRRPRRDLLHPGRRTRSRRRLLVLRHRCRRQQLGQVDGHLQVSLAAAGHQQRVAGRVRRLDHRTGCLHPLRGRPRRGLQCRQRHRRHRGAGRHLGQPRSALHEPNLQLER